MPNAFNNARGWVRDVRALREAAHKGDREAGSLLDALCDEMDMLIDFGEPDDESGDSGYDEGGGDPEELAEGDVDPHPERQLPLPAVGAGTRRVASVRGGAGRAVLKPQTAVAVRMGKHGKE